MKPSRTTLGDVKSECICDVKPLQEKVAVFLKSTLTRYIMPIISSISIQDEEIFKNEITLHIGGTIHYKSWSNIENLSPISNLPASKSMCTQGEVEVY